MSTAGKVFVAFNLVLAALFVGSAAALVGTSQDYRSQFDAEKAAHAKDNQTKQQEIDDLEQQVNELTRQGQQKGDQIQQLDAAQKALAADLETERQQNADLRESLNGIEAKLGDLEQTNRGFANQVADLTSQVQSLREERDQAMDARDGALAAQTKAEEKARLAEAAAADLRLQLARTTDRAETAEASLAAAAKQYGFDQNAIGAQPMIDGVVLAASYDASPAIIQISVGKDQKVQPGFTFDVYNGSAYKGRIRVEVVNSTNSSCTIAMASGPQIERGDRITTRL